MDEGVTLEPRYFKIVLIVNAMETTGGSHRGKNGRKSLSTKELEDSKAIFKSYLRKYQTRGIPVGNFCWVAKEVTTDDLLKIL